jgi:hypothetical protein
VSQLPKNDRHLNLRLPQDLYDKALAAATADSRPLSSWVRKLVHRELADRLSAEMDAEDRVTYDAVRRLEVEFESGPPQGFDEATGITVTARDDILEGEAYVVSQGIVRVSLALLVTTWPDSVVVDTGKKRPVETS